MMVMDASNIINFFNKDESILSELFRLEQLQQIILDIKTIYVETCKTPLDTFKNKKISVFVSLWIMNQFNSVNTSDVIPDPIFPYQGSNNKQLELNLVNTGIVSNAIEAANLVANWNLSQRMTSACVAVSKFLQSPEFQTAKHEYKVIPYEEYISSSRFVKLKISSSSDIKRFKYGKPTKFFVPYALYQKLISKYNKYIPSIDDCTLAVCKLFLRYYTLDSDNQQLAVVPEFYTALDTKYKINIELFASGINAFCQHFASLYYDIERPLGSIGYFNNYEILETDESQLLVANPPFDEDIMLGMTSKFIKWLSVSSTPISIVLTIPQWGEYASFETFEKLKNCGYMQYHWIIPKTSARFYNYTKDKFVYPCNVYLIVLQNALGVSKYPNLVNDLAAIKNAIYN